jgi:glycosyltransferase involved in cell wall biosynthesis
VARRAESSAGRLERATIKRADAVLVFSDKDRQLLIKSAADSCGKLELVDPPLSFGEPVRHKPSRAEPVVVFVGFLSRPENEDAALWLVRHVWPMVRRQAPEARLHVVGADASDRLIEAMGGDGTVQLRGFVEDLGAVYAGASVCAIPLRLGAGVKFKTLEALIAGVPTVTTSVGAEGIAGPEKFAGFADDAEGFADAVAWVLRNPDAADQLARQAQSWACANYDARRFALAVGRLYGVSA